MKLDRNSTNIGSHNAHSIFWTPVTVTELINLMKNIKELTPSPFMFNYKEIIQVIHSWL